MQDTKPGPTSFGSKSAGWRITILSAGVAMNVVLAAGLLMVQGVVGYPTVVTEANEQQLTGHHTYIVEVAANSPAETAGIKALDRIVRLDTINDPTIEQVQARTVAEAEWDQISHHIVATTKVGGLICWLALWDGRHLRVRPCKTPIIVAAGQVITLHIGKPH